MTTFEFEDADVRNSAAIHSFYAARKPDGTYFAGFDTTEQKSRFVTDPLEAKLYTNKFEIPLRPEETMVEVLVELTTTNTRVSDPFRPKMRKNKDQN